ncbi:MAG: trimethylamine methyltransferase family protein [Pseudomonadota bacterium]
MPAIDRDRRRRSRRRPQHSQSCGAQIRNFAAFFTREIGYYDLLSLDALDKIERHADWILDNIGILIQDDPVALRLFDQAGARVDGDSVKFDPGLAKDLCATAPSQYTMYARNPQNNIEFGGNNLVLAPAYGSPFVTDMQQGRRYGQLSDFENFIKLTYQSPWLHHQSGTVCEPVDIPVNKRHLDMVYAHLKYSDKPFMGSVTAPERAADSIKMAEIVFGEEFMQDHLVIQGNINVNSPLVYDGIMSSALRTYASANQGNVISPFILAGAMSPVSMAALVAQAHAEALAGIALTQLVRPGSPVVYGSFLTTMDLKTGAPTFGTPESSLATLAIAQLCRRMDLPFRCGGHLTASKLADAQAMQESIETMQPAIMGGANFIFQAAGWLEGGLTIGYEKFVMDLDRCGAVGRLVQGMRLDEEDFASDAYLEAGPGSNFLGVSHTMRHFRNANFDAPLADTNSFEQWSRDGSKDMLIRANERCRQMLEDYQPPELDPAIDHQLVKFIADRKSAVADAWY